MATQLATAASGVPRDGDYELSPISGLYERATLLELAATNALTAPADFTNAAWVKTTCTVTTGIPDPAGGTAANTLTATGALGSVKQTLSVGSSLVRINSIYLRRRTGTGNINLWSPSDVTPLTITGLPTTWTRYSVANAAASTARKLTLEIATNGDAIDVYHAQQEDGAVATSPHATSRAVDSLSFPFPWAPTEMTLLVEFYEKGAQKISGAGAGLLSICNSGRTTPRLDLYAGSALLGLDHYYDGGGVNVRSSPVACAAVSGDLVRMRAVLYSDGSVQSGQSLNGGAETLGTRSASASLAAAWSAQLLWLGSLGSSLPGCSAFRKVLVKPGVQTLSTMLAA